MKKPHITYETKHENGENQFLLKDFFECVYEERLKKSKSMASDAVEKIFSLSKK